MPLDGVLHLNVVRFDSDSNGAATLVARWYLSDAEGVILVPMTRSEISAPASSAEFDATAAAMSQAIASLAEEIAQAVP